MIDKESFYFPHEYNPTSDPKIVCLLGNHGGLGYAVYWRSVEMLHQEKSNKLPLKKYIFEAIAKQMLANAKQIEDVINDCIKVYELFESDNVFFWSNRVLRNLEKRAEISNVRREAGKKGAEAKQSLAIAKQNLANDSKEKESKEKEIKEKEISNTVIVASSEYEIKNQKKLAKLKNDQLKLKELQSHEYYQHPEFLELFEEFAKKKSVNAKNLNLIDLYAHSYEESIIALRNTVKAGWVGIVYEKSNSQVMNGKGFFVQKTKAEKSQEAMEKALALYRSKNENIRDVEIETKRLPAEASN